MQTCWFYSRNSFLLSWEVVGLPEMGEIWSWLCRCPNRQLKSVVILCVILAGLKGLFAAPWVVAAALQVELGHPGLLKMESIKCEVVLGEQVRTWLSSARENHPRKKYFHVIG